MNGNELVEQGSDEWFAARLGKVTASRVADVMAKTKSGYSASRSNYMAELICERLTGRTAERFTNSAMQWGSDTEPQARAAYEFMTDNEVTQVGLIDHGYIQMFGASPDGMIEDDGLLEIKCPNSATHIDTLLTETIAGKYITQMQVQMACTGRKWCDFVSFDPRLPAEMQLWIRRVDRDDAFIREMESEVVKFLAELDERERTLRDRFMRDAA